MTQLMEPRTDDRSRRRLRSVGHPEPDRGPARRTAAVPLWRRIVPGLAIAVMVVAYVYATVPFTFAGVLRCHQQGLSGATVAPGTPAGTIIGDMDQRCAETGNSRIAVAATAAGLAAVVGLAAAFAPTDAEVRARKAEGDPGDGTRRPAGGRRVPARAG